MSREYLKGWLYGFFTAAVIEYVFPSSSWLSWSVWVTGTVGTGLLWAHARGTQP